MTDLKCPRCGKRFPRQPGEDQVCPACAFRATVAGQVPSREGVTGRPRRAWVALLLGLVTLGIHGAYLRFKLFDELDKQHARPGGLAAWILSFLPGVGLIFYMIHTGTHLRRLQDYRRARGLRRGLGPFGYLVLSLPGNIVFYGVLVANYVDPSLFKAFGDYKTNYLSFATWLPPVEVLGGAIVLWLVLRLMATLITVRSCAKLWRRIYDEHGEIWPWPDA